MEPTEHLSRHLWCPHCVRERLAYIEDMTLEGRMTLRGGPARHLIRCSLCLIRVRPGSYALAVTFFAAEDDYEPWETEYLNIKPVEPASPRNLTVKRAKPRRAVWSVGERTWVKGGACG